MCCFTCNLQPLCDECVGEKSMHIGHKYCHLTEAFKHAKIELTKLIDETKNAETRKYEEEERNMMMQNKAHYDKQLGKIQN